MTPEVLNTELAGATEVLQQRSRIRSAIVAAEAARETAARDLEAAVQEMGSLEADNALANGPAADLRAVRKRVSGLRETLETATSRLEGLRHKLTVNDSDLVVRSAELRNAQDTWLVEQMTSALARFNKALDDLRGTARCLLAVANRQDVHNALALRGVLLQTAGVDLLGLSAGTPPIPDPSFDALVDDIATAKQVLDAVAREVRDIEYPPGRSAAAPSTEPAAIPSVPIAGILPVQPEWPRYNPWM